MRQLEWHDRQRDERGRFKHLGYGYRVNIRCGRELYNELKKRAHGAELEISEYIKRAILTAWAVWDAMGDDETRDLVKQYAPNVYFDSMFTAEVSQLMQYYSKPEEDRRRWRRRGFQLGDNRRTKCKTQKS